MRRAQKNAVKVVEKKNSFLRIFWVPCVQNWCVLSLDNCAALKNLAFVYTCLVIWIIIDSNKDNLILIVTLCTANLF